MYRLSATQSRRSPRCNNECVNETVASAHDALSALRRLSRTYEIVYIYDEDGHRADVLDLLKGSFSETRGCGTSARTN
ncbi:protein of unknown function [Beijerinckiaceae bacterium RH AL1]|nr:protein of unknown function [Beijerinckiaceae bacterium RH CH11]VVB45717.1 protein of unknown function [Beijerinckiaceae bacterium RH AL8]VVC54967.1 protein of unknown function [Beijerinckiaceae bacterium RH AL1]